MKIRTNKFAAAALATALAFGAAACDDTTDGVQEDTEEMEQEMDEGAEDMESGAENAESEVEEEIVEEASENE